MGWMTKVQFLAGRIFLFTTMSRSIVGTIQPPVQWVQGVKLTTHL
jgi:hypothetical protein